MKVMRSQVTMACSLDKQSSDKVLSYHDVVLRQGDIDLLEDGRWLNDQVREPGLLR
jgi:hypothetical protein